MFRKKSTFAGVFGSPRVTIRSYEVINKVQKMHKNGPFPSTKIKSFLERGTAPPHWRMETPSSDSTPRHSVARPVPHISTRIDTPLLTTFSRYSHGGRYSRATCAHRINTRIRPHEHSHGARYVYTHCGF